MVKIALAFTCFAATAMLASGDSNARMVAQHQPAKLGPTGHPLETSILAETVWCKPLLRVPA